MRFDLVDRIEELEPGQRIRTQKALSLAEEYLSDHFPSFPVMPGVLMLECMAQSAAWLVRATDDFAHSVLWLEEAKNVVYKSFVAPGRILDMEVKLKPRNPDRPNCSEFVGSGRCHDSTEGPNAGRGAVEVVKARIWLRHVNLADDDARLAKQDRELVAHARQTFAVLGGESLMTMAG